MTKHVDARKLATISAGEYAIRFVCGGIITVMTGLIAHKWGPVVGGLFLGFPAILPASLTLIQKHDSTAAARHDSFGSTAGSIGLAAFGVVTWLLPAVLPGAAVLAIAAAIWFGAALGAYAIGDRLLRS